METNPQTFEMVAKTFQGLEEVLAEELRGIGALNVEPGRRMVSFDGTLETLYRANMCCRTALRILKPVYKFYASDPDTLYDRVKEFDWGSLLNLESSFAIDSVVNSDEFTHSRYVTYRVKDGIVDWFQDRYGLGKRPKVRLQDADVVINVHISAQQVTLSLDSSGESLHKRGWRVATTEAPINEVLAAGIILKSGWRGDQPLVDPMCGSGTFLVEAALIATGTMPGVFRKEFAFEKWADFDADLFDQIYNDESMEHPFEGKIYGSDISPLAVDIAMRNLKSAGMARYVDLKVRPLARWEEAPEGGTPGVMVTNPPYGERISVDDMDRFYELIGNRLKYVFKGYHAWIIGYHQEYFDKIGLAPSYKETLYNGSLECQLREYVIFEGDYKQFRAAGGTLRRNEPDEEEAETEYRVRREKRQERPKAKGHGHWDDHSDERLRHDKPRRHDKDDRFRRDDDRPRRKFDDRPRRDRDDRFSRDDDRPRRKFDDRQRRDDRFRRDDDRPRRNYDERPRRDDDRREGAEENALLGRRRNPRLLEAFDKPTTPSLPDSSKVFLRERRGKVKPRPASDDKTPENE